MNSGYQTNNHWIQKYISASTKYLRKTLWNTEYVFSLSQFNIYYISIDATQLKLSHGLGWWRKEPRAPSPHHRPPRDPSRPDFHNITISLNGPTANVVIPRSSIALANLFYTFFSYSPRTNHWFWSAFRYLKITSARLYVFVCNWIFVK